MKMVYSATGLFSVAAALLLGVHTACAAQTTNIRPELSQIKAEIITLAQSFAGQGDPDFSKQKAFDTLIQKLLLANPQPPLKERLPLLHGAWKQVWGPYDYRNKQRGIDPELGVDEIYQVLFAGGYYYNVSPLYTDGDRRRERIGLLRGEFKFDAERPNVLLVRFTQYPGLSARPKPPDSLPDLAAQLESGTLKSDASIVPTWVVRLFFGSGALNEVYTDADLRILYGADSNRFENPALYIMTRVAQK
ncbi:MAG: hypothetical protein ACKVIH_05875 [Burkholderiales bacterium]